MKKVNVPLTIGTDGEDGWEPFMFASMGPTRKPVIAKIAEGGFEIYVVCDSPSAPIDLTAIERVFTNMEDAMSYADMLAEDERWQSLMDENKRGASAEGGGHVRLQCVRGQPRRRELLVERGAC